MHTHVAEFGFTCSSLLFNVRIAEFRPAVCDLRVRSLTRSSVKPYSFASVAMAANSSGSVSGLACRTVLYSDDCVWDLRVAKPTTEHKHREGGVKQVVTVSVCMCVCVLHAPLPCFYLCLRCRDTVDAWHRTCD